MVPPSAVDASNEQLGLASFMRRRGYPDSDPIGLLRRMFFVSWAQPGFHNFWRVWNPLYGFFLFRIYVRLGGNRRPLVSTLVVFVFCGFALHDLPLTIVFGRPFLSSTLAFLVFGICTIASRMLEPRLRPQDWPTSLNCVVNIALVVGGLAAGGALASLVIM